MGRKDNIKSFYEPKIGQGLPDYQVLGWESPEAQFKRFDILVSNVDISGKKVLDVGCGLGNLLEYLNAKGIDVDYTGVDISEKMIDCVKRKKPGARFYCIDIFKTDFFEKDSFDVVFSSGIFNINLGNNREFLKNALTRFFELSKHTVVFNLLHHQSPDKEDTYFYFSPEEVVGILEGLPVKIEKIRIVENYLKNDFTVICDKA